MEGGGFDLYAIGELEKAVGGRAISRFTIIGSSTVNPDDDGGSLPESYWSTHAMKARAGARLAVLDAQLEEKLIELVTLVGESRSEALSRTDTAWKAYRSLQMSYAASEFEEDTHAPLAGTLEGIGVTRRRIEELTAEIDRRKARLQ